MSNQANTHKENLIKAVITFIILFSAMLVAGYADKQCFTTITEQTTNQNKQTMKKPVTTPEIVLKKIKTDFPKIQIKTSKQAEEFIRMFYSDDIGIYESFFILLLNRASKTVGFAKISQGGIAETVVDVKIIAKYAIDVMASAVILAHNHPSGTTYPSQADRDITRKIKEALKLLDSEVLDHIILTEDSYYSFADNGLI